MPCASADCPPALDGSIIIRRSRVGSLPSPVARCACAPVVPEELTIYEAASVRESLLIILIGAVVVLAMIGGHMAPAHTILRGKAQHLPYD